MYHSITFGDGSLYPSGHEKEGQFMGTNTWDDWHLIPAERPSIAAPGVSTNFVEIPGRDGAIDMSNFLISRPVYGGRSGSWDFIVDNDHEYWETIRMKIMTFLHGKRFKIVLEDDPNWYWEGRFAVSDWNSESSNSRIQINYQIDTYKKRLRSSGDNDVIWDNFNFESDYDYYTSFGRVELHNSTYESTFTAYDYPFKVYVHVNGGSNVTVNLNGKTVNALAGETTMIGKATPGVNVLSLTGNLGTNGYATVFFTEGSL